MNILARMRQFAFAQVMGVLPDRQLKLSGEGVVLEAVDLLRTTGHTHVFLATTPGMIRRGVLTDVLASLASSDIEALVYTDIEPDPTVESAEAGARAYLNAGCDSILAIGGGSVMDCAKMVGALAVNPGKNLADLAGFMKVRHALPYFIAVPTTAGSGSEVTAGAVITNTIPAGKPVSDCETTRAYGEQVGSGIVHDKQPITDARLVPHVALLDPNLTLTLPPKVTAHAGMDALSHAIEAYTNRFAQKRTRLASQRAVVSIFANLRAAYDAAATGTPARAGEGRESVVAARAAMLEASYDAGYAITHNYVGYVHAISHAIGSLYGLPHGYVNAILMPHILRAYGASVERKLAALAVTAGVAALEESEGVRAERFIAELENLNAYFGIPNSVEELRVEDFGVIASRAVREAKAYPVPCMWDESDIAKLLTRLR